MISVTTAREAAAGPFAIQPEPPEQEREAIVAALAEVAADEVGGWFQAALAAGVEAAELHP